MRYIICYRLWFVFTFSVPAAVMSDSISFTPDPGNSTTQVKITWHLPGDMNVADSFTILYKKNGSMTETEITTQFVSSSSTYDETIGGLDPGQEYAFQVISISSPWNASSIWFMYTTCEYSRNIYDQSSVPNLGIYTEIIRTICSNVT